jgi:ABC-type Fe3+/spermidine/putrescine transport system ATPase subunit
VYDAPASVYVADFLGLANLLPGAVIEPRLVDIAGRRVAADTGGVRGDCTVFARPERLRIVDASDDGADVHGTVADVVFVGSMSHIQVDVDSRKLHVVVPNDGSTWVPAPGTAIGVAIPADAVRLLAR